MIDFGFLTKIIYKLPRPPLQKETATKLVRTTLYSITNETDSPDLVIC